MEGSGKGKTGINNWIYDKLQDSGIPKSSIKTYIKEYRDRKWAGVDIAKLIQEAMSDIRSDIIAGYYNIILNGKDENEEPVSSGIYFYKMETDNFSEINKCILMK